MQLSILQIIILSFALGGMSAFFISARMAQKDIDERNSKIKLRRGIKRIRCSIKK